MSEVHHTNKVITLLVTCLGLFMVFLDGSIVNVALPTIQADLHANLSDLQWVVDAYTLPFAALMLTAGTLGDRFGRKRLFLTGLVMFLLGSTLCDSHRHSAGCSSAARCKARGPPRCLLEVSRCWWRPFPSNASARRPLAFGQAFLVWAWLPGRSLVEC